MGLLQPVFLAGTLALGIPILLHLIHRQRYPNVRFSTLDFFEKTIKHNVLQTRLIDILLLILRLAALALLVLACVRLFVSSDAGKASSVMVIVLDNSGSMSARREAGGKPVSAFEAAKRAAGEVIEGLRKGDRVAILPTVGRGSDGLTYGKEEALRRLDGIEQEFRSGDLRGALETASGLLRRDSFELGRLLLILSDGHAGEWKPAPSLEGLPADVALHYYPRRSEGNLAVTGAEFSEKPASAGVPVQISVAVRNFGLKGTGPVKVELTLHTYGGAFTPKMIRSVAPGETRVVDFTHVFHSRDLQGGFATVSGQEDAYPADDTFYFIPQVRDIVRALVVNGVESAKPSQRASFFLSRALQPTSPESAAAGLSPVIVDEADISQVERKIFYDYGVVVTANVGRLPAKCVQTLKEYVRHGGAWLAFLGDQADIQVYNALGLLPGTLRVLHRPPMSVVISDYEKQHPALGWFSRQGKGELGLFSFSRYFEFVPDSAETTRVLASYSDGRSAVVESRQGDGRVMVFTSNCHTDWSDMPLRPAFLVLVQRLVEHLAGGARPEDVRDQFLVGESLFEAKPKGPFGKDRGFVGPGESVLGHTEDAAGIRSVPVREPGIYVSQPRQATKAEELMLDRRPYAVNVPLDESTPEFLKPEEVGKRLGVEVRTVENAFESRGAAEVRRKGDELVTAVCVALLLVLVVESLVGWRSASESGR